MTRKVFAITGTIGAGKDTAGEYIARTLGIPCVQISAPLKEICAKEGLAPTREQLISLGTRLSATYGDGYLASYILENTVGDIVVTGLRQLGQLEVMDETSNMVLLSIDAHPTIRFERVKRNGKLSEAQTLSDFIANEQAENAPPNAQRLFECMERAQYHLINESTFDELYLQLNPIIDKYK